MAPDTQRSEPKERHVTWEDLRGSGSDISLDTDGHQVFSMRKDVDDALGPRRTRQWACWCLRGLAKLSNFCLEPPPRIRMTDTFVPGDKPVRIRGKLTGHLWKLNNNVPPTMQHFRKLSSWRRRLFLIEDADSGMTMLYLSEKEDGLVVPAAVLRGRSTKGGKCVAMLSKIEVLPEVVLERVADDLQYSTMNSLKQYEIAFFGGQGAGVKKLPEKLYPMKLHWKSADGKDQQLVLAVPQDVERKAWMVVIRTSAGLGMIGHAVG